MPNIEDIVKDTRHRYYGYGPSPQLSRRDGRDHRYSYECWKIQFYGKGACRFCSEKPEECSGRFILHTGRNELGYAVPLRQGTVYQADLGLSLPETPEQTMRRLYLLIHDEIEARYKLIEDEIVEPLFDCEKCDDGVVVSEWHTSEYFDSALKDAEGYIIKFCSEVCRDQHSSDHDSMWCEGCGRDMDTRCFHWDETLQENICETCYSQNVFECGTDEKYLEEEEIPRWPDSLTSVDLENEGFRPLPRRQRQRFAPHDIGGPSWQRLMGLWATLRKRGLVAVFKETTYARTEYVSMFVKPMSKNRFRKNVRNKNRSRYVIR